VFLDEPLLFRSGSATSFQRGDSFLFSCPDFEFFFPREIRVSPLPLSKTSDRRRDFFSLDPFGQAFFPLNCSPWPYSLSRKWAQLSFSEARNPLPRAFSLLGNASLFIPSDTSLFCPCCCLLPSREFVFSLQKEFLFPRPPNALPLRPIRQDGPFRPFFIAICFCQPAAGAFRSPPLQIALCLPQFSQNAFLPLLEFVFPSPIFGLVNFLRANQPPWNSGTAMSKSPGFFGGVRQWRPPPFFSASYKAFRRISNFKLLSWRFTTISPVLCTNIGFA